MIEIPSYKQLPKETDEAKLTDWANAPSLADLQNDYTAAKTSQDAHETEVKEWLNVLEGKQDLSKVKPGRSTVVPKLVRKTAEWRYASLAEPFLSTENLFKTYPTTYKDKQSAEQNGLVLNYQFNCRIDKVTFIDNLIRTLVDEGTAVLKTGWEYAEEKRTVYEDVIEQVTALDPTTGQPVIQEVITGTRAVDKIVPVKNQPTIEVCSYKDVTIDPTCYGNVDKAKFVIYSFITSLSELKKDGRYKNLDKIDVDSASLQNSTDTSFSIEEAGNFSFKDDARKNIIAREYWGYWDINDTGQVEPIVATWVGNTLIRMEENPFPDRQLPFVVINYMPRRQEIYGEPDTVLLSDNQKIIGAITRGIIDTLGRSANGQTGIRKDALDKINLLKYMKGEDYLYNTNVDPKAAFHMGTYPEIPASALQILNMNNSEAETLTGLKAFTPSIAGQALNNKNERLRNALDITSKRELGILRRIANGLTKIGRKIISMNTEFLEDSEIIRITDDEFVTINRNDLGGYYDIKLEIATAESDEQRAAELSFLLQTMGNSMPLELSQLVLAEIAKLKKMPVLAKQIENYKQAPNELAQQKELLEIELLKAQIANEQAKANENSVDVQLKQAKTMSEQAKAKHLNSKADLDNLEFVEKESGVNRVHEANMAQLRHQHELEKQNTNIDINQQNPLNNVESFI